MPSFYQTTLLYSTAVFQVLTLPRLHTAACANHQSVEPNLQLIINQHVLQIPGRLLPCYCRRQLRRPHLSLATFPNSAQTKPSMRLDPRRSYRLLQRGFHCHHEQLLRAPQRPFQRPPSRCYRRVRWSWGLHHLLGPSSPHSNPHLRGSHRTTAGDVRGPDMQFEN